MSRRTFRGHPALLLLLFCGLVSSGCSSDYRKICRHEVQELREDGDSDVVVVEERFIAHREVLERSANVKSLTRLTNLRHHEQPGDFAVSADGKWIVYPTIDLAEEPPSYNLWRKATDGSGGAAKLTGGSYLDIQPAIDASSRFVYFASNRGSTLHSIWRVSLDGAGGIARVTAGDSMDLWPHVDPWGSQVYYTSRPVTAADKQLWRIGANGNLPTQMREGWRPRVSPDGKRVLYCAPDGRTGESRIWVMNADGGHQTQLTGRLGNNQRDPSWSASGRRILFASDRGRDTDGRRNYDIWIMDADGSHPTRITKNGSTDLLPMFDPSGRYVYFLSNRGFEWNIWRLEVTEPVRLAGR